MSAQHRSTLVILSLATLIPLSVMAQGVRLRPVSAIYVDALGAPLSRPEAVALDGESRLIVADSGNRRLVVYDLTEESAVPASEIQLAEVPSPLQIRVSVGGEILALDGRSLRIARISPSGEFRGFVDLPNRDRKQQVIVRNFDVDQSGNLYVLATSEATVLMLDPEGQLQREIPIPPEVGFFSDIAVTTTGVLYALDTLNRQIFVSRLDSEGFEPLTQPMHEDMAFPTSLAVDDLGHIFVVDKSGGGIVIVSGSGAFEGRQSARGWKEGALRHPTGIAISGDDLFVADRSNNRVQRFQVLN